LDEIEAVVTTKYFHDGTARHSKNKQACKMVGRKIELESLRNWMMAGRERAGWSILAAIINDGYVSKTNFHPTATLSKGQFIVIGERIMFLHLLVLR